VTNLVGTTIASRYRIERHLGEGGMGEVFEASAGACRYALKLVKHDKMSVETLSRFLRESTLTKSIIHPHVVPVVDVGTDPALGMPYIVMPLLEGSDLFTVLSDKGMLAPQVSARILRQACFGLQAAHAAGIVHRDIKPSNLFLERDPNGQILVRVMDFGIAKQLDPVGQASLTRTGHALGSPEYMSPEQIRSSKHVDARSDVFSAGVVLYELLCGKLPWDTNRPLSDVMVAICTEDAPRLRQHAGWIEPALEGVVMRALARDPADRWQSVRDLADALAPFAGGSDVIRPEDLQPPDDTSRFAAVLKSGPHVKSDATTVGALEIREVTDPLIGRVLGGLYRLKRVIGRGGMGSVYEADPPDGKSVAIKLISTEVAGDDDQTVRRFLREAQAAKLVESPHVTRTLELSLDSELGAPFLVMELLTGIDLAALVKERAPLEPEPVVRLFIQAARGLAAAHAKGVVHRDIKPANFFLHEAAPGAGVTVKVCDFGIAKRVDAVSREQSSRDLTRTGGILGSPVYMSPEQAKNAKNVDHRSDIWSLCVSLYEALSGRQLWQEYTSFGEIIVAICTEPVPPLRDHAPWLDEALARVVHRGLERDVKQRWQSADELIAALEPFSGGRVDFTLAELTTIDVSCSRAILASSTARPSISRRRSQSPSGRTQASERRGDEQPGAPRWSRWALWRLCCSASGACSRWCRPGKPR
jgi:serine/threonine protein kinase